MWQVKPLFKIPKQRTADKIKWHQIRVGGDPRLNPKKGGSVSESKKTVTVLKEAEATDSAAGG